MTDEELKLCNLCGSRLFDGGVDWYCSNRNCDGPACEELVANIMTDRTNYCTGCKERQDRIEALTAENKWLRHCLKNANDKHEFYEREWYLRGDRIEALTAALIKIREHNNTYGGSSYVLRIIEEALEKQP
jgi:hypothetical protein